MNLNHEAELAVLKLKLEHDKENVEALRQEMKQVRETVAELNNTILRYKGAGSVLIMGLTGLWAALTLAINLYFNRG